MRRLGLSIGSIVGAVALTVAAAAASGGVLGAEPEIIEPQAAELPDAAHPSPDPPVVASPDARWVATLHLAWACAASAAIWRRRWTRFALESTRPGAGASVSPGGAGVVLIAAGVVIYCAQVIGLASAQALFLHHESPPGVTPELTLADTAFSMAGRYTGAIIATAFVAMLAPGIARLAAIPNRWRDAASGIGKGVAGIAVVYPLAWVAGWAMLWIAQLIAGPDAVDPIAHETLHQLEDNPATLAWWGVILMVTLGAPIVEELIFRGFLQRGVSMLTGSRWVGILATSVLFTAVHVSAAAWHALPVLFLLSIGLGVARARTNNIAASITMHALFNVANVAMAFYGF